MWLDWTNYVLNATFANFTALEMYPSGDYFNTWYFYDNLDDNIMNASFFGRLLFFSLDEIWLNIMNTFFIIIFVNDYSMIE